MASPRPSTSGGLSSRRGGYKNNFEKRMSKDDSALNIRSRQAMNQTMASTEPVSRDDLYVRDRKGSMSNRFHIPVRGSTITPEHSPFYPGSQEALIPIRLQTPESITSGEIPIGMALGSPAHIPSSEPSRWQAQFPPPSPQTTDVSPTASPAASTLGGGSLQRKKTGRRKLFGLFGGSKKNAVDEGSRDSSSVAKNSVASTSTVSVVPKTPKTPTRSNTQSDARMPRHKPLTLRSNTMPYNKGEDGRTTPEGAGRNSTSKGSDAYLRQVNENRALPPVPPVPRLEVLIPNTKMERYSVMFSDLLRENGKQQEPAASLLARRQATLERLKTINGNNGGYQLEPVLEDDRARPRRATSPQPQIHRPRPGPAFAAEPAFASPRLSVFPMPPTGRPELATDTSATQPRVARSHTSPGRLPSPTKPTFDNRRKAPNERGALNLEVPNPFQMNPPERPSPRTQEPIYPTDTSFHFGPDESGLYLDSPTSMESHEEIIISQPYKPTLHEPQWQMVSPSNTNASSVLTTASSGLRGRSPSNESASTHITKPSSELDPQDAALQNAVEVSIARQISISRQQRNLLRPLNTRRGTDTTRPTGPSSAGSSTLGDSRSPIGVTVIKAPSPGRLGKDEPIKETKISTPVVVHRRGSPVDPQNRKSSWVVLESD